MFVFVVVLLTLVSKLCASVWRRLWLAFSVAAGRVSWGW